MWWGRALSCFIQPRRFSAFSEASKRASSARWAAAPASVKPSIEADAPVTVGGVGRGGGAFWGAAAAVAARARAKIGRATRDIWGIEKAPPAHGRPVVRTENRTHSTPSCWTAAEVEYLCTSRDSLCRPFQDPHPTSQPASAP